MAVLLLADVNGGQLATDAVAKALTAVKSLGDVTLLVAGPATAAAEAAKPQPLPLDNDTPTAEPVDPTQTVPLHT